VRDWSDYQHPKIAVIRQYARNRAWLRIAEITGLEWDEARELGRYLRGVPPRGAPVEETPPDTDAGVSVAVAGDVAEVVSKGCEIRNLQQLIRAAEIDLDRWIVDSWSANTWEMGSGDGEKIRLWQVKASLRRRPEWARHPVQPVRHMKRQRTRSTSPRACALVIPDSQNGYRWDTRHQHLDPLHDRRAWDLAVQMAQRLQPDVILLLGDMVDLGPWSTKYHDGADLRGTTQPTLVELHWWLGQLRLASPGAQIVYLEGNHEDRVGKALRQLMPEAEGVRPADDETGAPMLSIQRLLALDSLDVEYVGPYDSEYWLWDSVRVHHGETVRGKGGATATATVSDAVHCDIFGHVHRLELACRTLHGPGGERVIWALSPGTITRIDGVVPAFSSRVNWQQGLAVLERTDDERIFPQILKIEDGRTVWCREVLEGRDRVDELREATGWSY
jgi:hypothetical protein